MPELKRERDACEAGMFLAAVMNSGLAQGF